MLLLRGVLHLLSEGLKLMYAKKRMVKLQVYDLTGAVADITVVFMSVVINCPQIKLWFNRICETCSTQPSVTMRAHGGLYLIICLGRRDAYLGETGYFIERWYDHILQARRGVGQHIHLHMHRVGVCKFIMVPLLIENDETCRQLAEIWAIKTYQPKLNRRVDRIMQFVTKGMGVRRNEGRRRVHKRTRIREAGDTIIPGQRPVVYTTYTWAGENVTSTMLDSVLKVAKDRGRTECRIEVHHGTHTVRPKKALTERYLDSVVSVCFPNGVWRGRQTLRRMADNKVPLHHATLLMIHNIVEVTGLELHKMFLVRLLHKPGMINNMAGSFHLALDLYKAAGLFRSPDTTRILRIRISTWAKKRFGTCLGSFKAINLAYTKSLDMAQIREYIFHMISKLPVGSRGRAWVRENVKFAHERQLRIHELVGNQRRAAKMHIHGREYGCQCGTKTYARVPHTCRDTYGCINAKLPDLAAYIPEITILAGNAKEVVCRTATRQVVEERLRSAIEKFTSQHVKPFFRGEVPLWLTHTMANLDATVRGMVKDDVILNESDIADEKQLRRAVDRLKGMVISQLDKNNGCLHVQCERRWHHAFEATFANNNHYQRIDGTIQEELVRQKRDYMTSDLPKVAKWNDAGALPYAYILKKNKNIQKCRPVVACVDHPARKAMTIAAKGGSMVIGLLSQLTRVRHFDLQDISRLADSMADDEEDNADVVVSAFDIQEMFTRLGKEVVLDDAWDLITLVGNCYAGVHSGYYVMKGKQQKAYMGKAPCTMRCDSATLLDIYSALEFEMDHTVFTAGDVILRQVKGVGIGGIMSPFGARSMCIMREWKWRQAMGKILKKPMTVCRLMDDSGMKYSLQDESTLFLFQFGAYARECRLERDVCRQKHMKFVGCDVYVKAGKGTIVVAHNKNAESILAHGTMQYQRYPHWLSELRMVVKVGTIIGQVIHMVRITSWNGYEDLYMPLWVLIREFGLKGYPWSILYRTFRHLDTCRLPVKTEGAREFTKMWYKVLHGLQLLAAGQSVLVQL
jgi:hypothetical protein